MKYKETCRVVEQKELMTGIYSLLLQTDRIAGEAKAGQFVSLYSADGARLLPRPISLCEIRREEKQLRLVYRIAGKGTAEFSQLQAGDQVEVFGPLGNGFPLEEAAGKRVLLIGGGIGIPPMLQTAKDLTEQMEKAKTAGDPETAPLAVTLVAGYRDVCFLKEDLEAAAPLAIATEDGSAGSKGTVLDAIREQQLQGDLIFACGPKPMLKGLAEYAEQQKIDCWISMEEKMACGVGACLACVCQTPEKDAHSNVNNKRICKDGPVFRSTEILL